MNRDQMDDFLLWLYEALVFVACVLAVVLFFVMVTP